MRRDQGVDRGKEGASINHTKIVTAFDLIPIQRYCCIVIPPFDDNGELPPGVHNADWSEFQLRYGSNGHRESQLEGLLRAAKNLKDAGSQALWVDGSFVTDKELPRDFDGCWDSAGVDMSKVAPALKEFGNSRAWQKAEFGGELFPADGIADAKGSVFLDFFRQSKASGNPKGIVRIDLENLP